MPQLSQIFTLTAAPVVVLLTCTLSFNVDQKNGLSFSGPLDDMFGYTVQQFENSEGKWVLIGSPHSGQPAKRTGDVYKCPVGKGNNTCVKLELPKNTTIPDLHEVKDNMTMGTTLVTNPTGGFLACGPQYGYMCGALQYISGVCANVSPSFQILNSIAPGVQNCTGILDIVFVLDGSNSIYPWSSIVNFLLRFLEKVQIGPKLSQVGIVSYGEDVAHRVNLSQFDDSTNLREFVKNLPRHGGTKTHTFLAIDTARKEAFMPERGARPNAKKVMVVLTDGESHDFYKQKDVTAACEKDNIERFGIAVLGYYNRENKSEGEVQKFLNEIKSISSDPIKDHFFNVSDELVLVNLTDTLGQKIFALEATSGNDSSSFEMEMSQTGFSAHAAKDGLLLGAVGAYDWNGTVVLQTAGPAITPGKDEFYDPKDKYAGLAGYFGYDVQSVSTPKEVLYITGAPRYNHTGRVVIYRMNEDKRVEIVLTLNGEQIGSYFGSVLQTVDINKDSYTDLLLVGAPMYMGPERDEQGKVYVYKLNKMGKFDHAFNLKPVNQSCCTVNSDGCTMKNEPCGARFGTAIAAVSDLNLDGFNDVVIGAPFENDHRGGVYIYHGTKRSSLKKNFVQHIAAGGDGEKVKFFGQSIHGIMDLNGDGITDVTIGGLGGASLFWSRDVAELHANMTFDPVKINLQKAQNQCEHKGRTSACVKISVCFEYKVKSDKKTIKSAEIRYNITLDALRSKARASFIDKELDKSDRKITKTFHIKDQEIICKEEKLIMSAKPDFRDPLSVFLEFGLGNEEEGPILDENLPKTINKTIPLVDCGDHEKCITDLSLKAEPSEERMLIPVSSKDKLDVNIDISNKGDSAYNTKVILSFTPNINYVKVEPEKECTPNHTRVECAVGYPFLGSNAQDHFKVKFETDSSHIHEKILINVSAVSDSEELPKTLHDNRVQISIPVKYEAGVIFSVDHVDEHIVIHEGEKYSLTDTDAAETFKEVKISYTVEKAGSTLTPPLHLTVTYPSLSPLKNLLLDPTHVDSSVGVKCENQDKDPQDVNKPKKETLSVFLLQCGQSECKSFSCSIPETSKSQVNVTFKVWKPTFIESDFTGLYMVVNASLTFKQTHLLELSSNAKSRSVKIQISKDTVEGISIWIIIISILIGLLILALIIFIFWKLGFFERKSPDFSKEEMSD